MDDDINLDLSPNRKSAPGPKVGRRAFASAASFEARDRFYKTPFRQKTFRTRTSGQKLFGQNFSDKFASSNLEQFFTE
jgi:hypothetical protein